MDIQSSDYQIHLQQSTDASLRLTARYRQMCEMGTTRDDLARLVTRFPERYTVFTYLLDCPEWDSMADLNH